MSTALKTIATRDKVGLRLPDFMIIGAAKCATTSFHEYLQRHPDIYMSTPKEPEFFSRDTVYSQGLDWYGKLFEECGEGQICGEASTTYSRFPLTPNVPERISRLIPDVKLIYVMRHPVDRAFSQYRQFMRDGFTMTFEEALCSREDLHRGWDGRAFYECSDYIKQIRHYLEFFPRESLHLVLYEDFVKNPKAELDRCQEFLGLDAVDLMEEGDVNANVAGTDVFVARRVKRLVRRIPGAHNIAYALPRPIRQNALKLFKNSVAGKRVASRHKVQPMTAETRAELLQHFRQSNMELSELLGQDLEKWNV